MDKQALAKLIQYLEANLNSQISCKIIMDSFKMV